MELAVWEGGGGAHEGRRKACASPGMEVVIEQGER